MLRSHGLMIQPLQNFEGRYHEELCRKVINDKKLDDEVLDKECECEY